MSKNTRPQRFGAGNKPNSGTFANINRPIASPTHGKELLVGKHPLQLYSLGTPNGVKVTIMLEELLALGHTGAEYDAWLIKFSAGGPIRYSSRARSCCIWQKGSAPFSRRSSRPGPRR
jgi:hypothetical protein